MFSVVLIIDVMAVMSTPRRLAYVRCGLAAVLFGASAPAAAHLAGTMPPVLLAGSLYCGAALAVLPTLLRRPPDFSALCHERVRLAVSIVAGGLIAPVLLVAGLARTQAATASLLLNLELVFTVTVAAVIFREHLGRRVITGALFITGAAVALTWHNGVRPEVGALLVAGACLCWAVDNSVTARIEQMAPEHITFVKGSVAGITNTVLGVLIGVGGTALAGVPPALVIGIVGYGFSITLWVKGARDLGAARAQIVFATAPFIGAVVSWLALGERATALQLLALAAAASGVVMTLGSAHTHEHVHRRMTHEHEHDHDVHHPHAHATAVRGRHSHRHTHEPVAHAHDHVPDLHHRHEH